LWIVVPTRSARVGSFTTVAITSVIGWGGVQEYLLLCITAGFNVGVLHVFNVRENEAV